MKRSRLINIINKSKEISNNKQKVENPFDKFKKSLPIEVDDNYRLESAWKAYGSPKDYKEALWQGLIQPIDENTFKLPSIGYNEETDEYEYLNKGRENETVDKDIRVWDNDVIPLVKELKLGGFIRIYDEEKDCWKYSKNKPQDIESFKLGGKKKIKIYLEGDSKEGEYIEVDSLDDDQRAGRKPIGKDSKGRNRYLNGDNKAVLNQGGRQNGDIPGFQKGEYTEVPSSLMVEKQIYPGAIIHANKVRSNKKPYSEWVKTVNPEYLENSDWYDLERAYNELPIEELEEWRLNGLKPIEERNSAIHLSGDYKTSKHPTYDDGLTHPEFKGRYGWFGNDKEGWEFRPSPRQLNMFGGIEYYRDYWDRNEPESTLILGEKGRPDVWTYKSIKTKKFKQGGQMNVIPEGALHARKNNMEGAGEDFTAKGIPVVSNDGEQVAEIEKNEIVFNKSVTDFIEENYKKFYNDETSNSEKDELVVLHLYKIKCLHLQVN